MREVRLERGLSQEQVGERAELYRNEIGVLERAETNPSLVNLLRVCRALELTPAELLQPFASDSLEELPPERSSGRREK